MKIINLKEYDSYLKEYITLCSNEWGTNKTSEEMIKYVEKKLEEIKHNDKIISIVGLINLKELVGFISLFNYDGDERKDLSPWYATMYVKEKYRGMSYSKILNNAIIREAKRLGYEQVYLKTNLVNYYEKFGAKYIETLNNGEKLYFIKISDNDCLKDKKPSDFC